MEQEASQMVPGRTQAEELAIEHEREPGQRVPGTADRIGESPAHPGPSEAMTHMDVVRDVTGVINVNETVADGGEENPDDERKEQDGKEDGAAVNGGVAGAVGHRRGRAASGCGERPGRCVGLGRAAV